MSENYRVHVLCCSLRKSCGIAELGSVSDSNSSFFKVAFILVGYFLTSVANSLRYLCCFLFPPTIPYKKSGASVTELSGCESRVNRLWNKLHFHSGFVSLSRFLWEMLSQSPVVAANGFLCVAPEDICFVCFDDRAIVAQSVLTIATMRRSVWVCVTVALVQRSVCERSRFYGAVCLCVLFVRHLF